MKVLKGKKAPGSGMELSPMSIGINRLRNGTKGVETSRQDPTQQNFQVVKRN